MHGSAEDFAAERLAAVNEVVLQRARKLHYILVQKPRVGSVLAAHLLDAVEDLFLALTVEDGNAVCLLVKPDLLGAVHAPLEELDQLLVNRVNVDADLF